MEVMLTHIDKMGAIPDLLQVPIWFPIHRGRFVFTNQDGYTTNPERVYLDNIPVGISYYTDHKIWTKLGLARVYALGCGIPCLLELAQECEMNQLLGSDEHGKGILGCTCSYEFALALENGQSGDYIKVLPVLNPGIHEFNNSQFSTAFCI
jgi:hypothetical protein